MADLITTAQALALLPGLTMGQQAAVSGLCSAASRAVERYCKWPLAYGTYDEVHRPGNTRTIRLKAPYALPGTLRLSTCLETILSIQCVDAAAQRATVTLTAASLTLASYSAAAPPATVLGLSSYATAGQLAAAVSAIAGWSATVAPARASWLVADLVTNPGAMGAVGTSVEVLAYVRDLACWAMDNPQLGVVELTEERPQAFRFPDRAYGGFGYGSGAWGGGNPREANVRCQYQAGFDCTGLVAGVPEVPEDLQLAVALTIRSSLDAQQFSGTITQANLGNTTFTIGKPMVLPAAVVSLLGPYRSRRF